MCFLYYHLHGAFCGEATNKEETRGKREEQTGGGDGNGLVGLREGSGEKQEYLVNEGKILFKKVKEKKTKQKNKNKSTYESKEKRTK